MTVQTASITRQAPQMSPVNVYLIIGNSNTRKTSLIRSLTGCFNRSVRDIQLQGKKLPMRFYARVGTLQDTRTSIADFVAEVERARCQAVICCLAPSAAHGNTDFPEAHAYIEGFKAAGWKITAVAVLGQNGGGVRATNLRQYPQASTAAINVTARDVRAQFGWL